MTKHLVTTVAALLLSASARVVHAQEEWIALWNPMMPAAVYFDGTPGAFVHSFSDLTGWPWASEAMSKGTLIVWLTPEDTQNFWSLIETAPTYTSRPFDGGGDGEVLDIYMESYDLAFLQYGWFSQNSDTPCLGEKGRCGGYNTYITFPAKAWSPIHIAWDTTQGRYEIAFRDKMVDLYNQWSLGSKTFSINHSAIDEILFFVNKLETHNDGVETPYKGGVSEYWLKFGLSLWPSNEVNRRRFVDETMHQVYLGPHGELPLERLGYTGDAAEPEIYFQAQNVGDRWACNVSRHGPLTDTANGKDPPRIPGPNAVITVGDNGWIPVFPGPLPPWPQIRTLGKC